MLFAALRSGVYSENGPLLHETRGVLARFQENRKGNRNEWP
jgi:hypothetical protein